MDVGVCWVGKEFHSHRQRELLLLIYSPDPGCFLFDDETYPPSSYWLTLTLVIFRLYLVFRVCSLPRFSTALMAWNPMISFFQEISKRTISTKSYSSIHVKSKAYRACCDDYEMKMQLKNQWRVVLSWETEFNSHWQCEFALILILH
jgi:hypothetical protein